MGLNLEPYAPLGRPRTEAPAVFVGDLEEGDLKVLEALGRPVAPPTLKTIRAKHHTIARCLAQGMKVSEVAIVAQCTSARVSQLQKDPTFKELVDFYIGKVDEVYFDRHRALSDLSVDAIEELSSRLEVAPEEFSISDLQRVVTMAADRTGLGPASTTHLNVNVGLAERLARARVRKAQDAILIEAGEAGLGHPKSEADLDPSKEPSP